MRLKRHVRREGPIDAETLLLRLQEAGTALLCLPAHRCLPGGFGSGWPEVVHEVVEAYGYDRVEIRPSSPDAATITRMDETFQWVTHIPEAKRVLRRLVLLRSLVHPVSDRHLYSWRRAAALLRCSHTAAQVWHAQAIDMMVAGINRPAVARLLEGQGLGAPLRPLVPTSRSPEQIPPSHESRS